MTKSEALNTISERQKHCPYCHPGRKINGVSGWYKNELTLSFLDDGYDNFVDLTFNPVVGRLGAECCDEYYTDINYCPWCGRYLGNEQAKKKRP